MGFLVPINLRVWAVDIFLLNISIDQINNFLGNQLGLTFGDINFVKGKTLVFSGTSLSLGKLGSLRTART